MEKISYYFPMPENGSQTEVLQTNGQTQESRSWLGRGFHSVGDFFMKWGLRISGNFGTSVVASGLGTGLALAGKEGITDLQKYISAAEAQAMLQKTSAELFTDYLKTITPTLQPEQREKLEKYLGTLGQ